MRVNQSKGERLFVNNFWDDKDVGFDTIVTRIKNSNLTMQELLDYYLERMNIEKEYNKKLERLNLVALGSCETGLLKKSLDKLNYENNEMIKYNYKFVKSINQINYDKLNHFYIIYNKKTKKILGHMSKIMSKKAGILKDLELTKETYKVNCSQIKSLSLTIQTTWGKELDKNEKKMDKLQQSLRNNEKNYQISIDNFNKINEIFKRDWLLALNEIYQLEIERIQLVKINCFNFCNNIATLCVDNDQSVDLARSYFAKISPPQDIQDFSNNYGTGDKIFVQPKFINFLDGLNDESDRNYEVADFEIPEFNHLLSRSYSTYSHATQQSYQSSVPSMESKSPSKSPYKAGSMRTVKTSPEKPLPPHISSPPKYKSMIDPSTPSPTKYHSQKHSEADIPSNGLPKLDLPKPEDTKSNYSANNLSPDEKDVFSVKSHKFAESNSSSNYSNPTNYSSNSSERNWASPRKKEKQLSQFQEKINMQAKELPALSQSVQQSERPRSKTPIMKDFSIDFIAKALEDLNNGGNGDVNQYRRSIRLERENEPKNFNSSTGTNEFKFNEVDDHNEVPTRYDTISFKAPKSMDGSPIKQVTRPKSMYDSVAFDPARSMNPQRTLSKARSFTNLNSMISKVTPINKKPYVIKAKARYNYKPQHHGELFFKKGWYIYVIHKQPDNWFLCELGDNCEDKVGLVGLIPGNYIVEGDDLF